MIPRQNPTRAETVAAAADVDAYGRLLIDQHTRAELAGACGITWGELAPAANRPGTVHWCSRPEIGHKGRHRCPCGEYHDGPALVICRFPLDGSGRECGKAVESLRREQHVRPGSVSARRPALRFQIVTSQPCGHVVRRGF